MVTPGGIQKEDWLVFRPVLMGTLPGKSPNSRLQYGPET